jgi:hypothetical protein
MRGLAGLQCTSDMYIRFYIHVMDPCPSLSSRPLTLQPAVEPAALPPKSDYTAQKKERLRSGGGQGLHHTSYWEVAFVVKERVFRDICTKRTRRMGPTRSSTDETDNV